MPARLSDAPLFRGIPAEEVDAMLPCLGASRRAYRRGERVMRAGQVATRVGVLLEGRLHVEMPDAWGNVSVLESVGPGEPFAVAYACGKEGVLDVDVVADADSTVATLEAARVLHPCERQCACHGALVRNLLVSMANKNIAMNRRAMAMAPKTVRGKILAYLSVQQTVAGTPEFAIPFTQEKLASYLGVDRSTLSAELSALRKEGVIDYKGRTFRLMGSGL
ncbi:Crp/Fnr family transcriptional regulator [uncultured Senegalimassilia sp.]|uniref:Crp/Fnr family transcriptional regulator n=1 Tax=uncultured Senegalimassilia sp. TaxID=1714350 RepID=UPI002673B331|nr:Crp/Fnr family transcriptional regulator [uncultured Senegalimassilia sp.]